MTPSKTFSHRHNRNGTVDSICHECFSTVATEQRESELDSRERLHSCNPGIVEWYQSLSLFHSGETDRHP